MDVFMTSATGYVGRAVALHLRDCGHRVVALARSAGSAENATRMGVRTVLGALGDVESYANEVRAAHVVVHTAFNYSSDGSENSGLDIATTRALLNCARSSEIHQFIYTSNGYLPHVSGEQLIDARALERLGQQGHLWRLGVEREVMAAGHANFHPVVLRLGMVYGGRGGGTITGLFDAGSRATVLPYLASARRNRWSLIHLADVASLYGTVIEKSGRGVFHAVDSIPVTVEAVFEAVAACCGTTAVAESETSVRSTLDAHTVDLMQRDVALHADASISLGWTPQFDPLSAGLAAACADWQQRSDV